MSTSTNPSLEEVKNYNTDQLVTFLERKNLNLSEDVLPTLREQEFDGPSFVSMTYYELITHLKGGDAKKLVDVIKELNEQNQPVASVPSTNPVNPINNAVPSTNPVINNAIVKAEALFNRHYQILVTVATNKYNPYPYFEASKGNSCKKFIDEKNIPIVNEEPNLLLHNLPEQGEEGLTDYDSLKNHIEVNLGRSNKTVILGTSGCGKTRLCFEALCHNYGLYLIAFPYHIGSIDLEESARWTKLNIEDKQPKEAEKIAELAVMSCIVGRLLLLQHLFRVAEEHNIIMTPKSWLLLQLNHVIFRELSLIFREETEMTDFNSIMSCCVSTMKNIKDKLTNIFPIVYDEAQAHTTYLPETFPAQLNQERVRAFFSVVVRTLSELFYPFTSAFVCITGSSLSLLRVRERDGVSAKGKMESHVLTFNKFGRIETSDELFNLATKIFPLEEEHVLFAIKWLKGRYRWSWTWIHYLIKSEHFDPEKQLKDLIKDLTTSADNLSNKQFSLYTGFSDLEKHPPVRPTYVNSTATLELVKRAIILQIMTGRPVTFTIEDEMDIMNLGFAHIKNIQNYTSIIDEPLAIQAGFNFFRRDLNSMWFQMMTQANFNATMSGLIWEKCIVNILREKLFESNTALSESGLFRTKVKLASREVIDDYDYLPEDFERPPQLLPNGDECFGIVAIESNTADNYIKWLKAVAAWEKTGNVPKNFCPICFPPNAAGPDISIVFHCPIAENDKLNEEQERISYILNVQVKLRKDTVITGSFKTVEPNLMFTDTNGKSNPPEANATLLKIYKEQNWFNRNIKMIIIFPCDPKRKGQYQQTSGSSKRKRVIPRVIIDMDNANVLFPEDCQEWIKDFKESNPEVFDCSDAEEEKLDEPESEKKQIEKLKDIIIKEGKKRVIESTEGSSVQTKNKNRKNKKKNNRK